MNDAASSSSDAGGDRPASTKGKLRGPKPPLRVGHVWSIRARLQLERRVRDLALFNLAIDSKLRGCDLVALRVDDVAPNGYAINATAERVASAPMFKNAYAKRRCLVPVNGFFEWKAVKGQKVKQPYAIAMTDDSPFALAGIWKNWKHPLSGEWLRTFCIITTTANDLAGRIHDRMPVIIPPESYDRWLANIEPDRATCWCLIHPS
jgi:hypothetical protein